MKWEFSVYDVALIVLWPLVAPLVMIVFVVDAVWNRLATQEPIANDSNTSKTEPPREP